MAQLGRLVHRAAVPGDALRSKHLYVVLMYTIRYAIGEMNFG